MDSDKIKRTFYLTPEANTKLDTYIHYCSGSRGTYGYTSQVATNAIMSYCNVPDEWRPYFVGTDTPESDGETQNDRE